MAKLPPKQESGDSQEWLNTYADMVTLLLTFFVLLFACSNLDETKLQYVYQAFQMRGKYVNTFVAEPADPSVESNGGITDDKTQVGGEGTMPQSFDELYQYLAEFIESNNLGDNVSIENSASYFTLRFNSAVLFNPDQALLTDDGRALIAEISPYLKALDPHIKMLTVTGHTAANTVSATSDWTLSSMRAASVANFLETGMGASVVNEQKYRTRGCGNTEPIATNDTVEGRQQNRRVELVMLKDDVDTMPSDVLEDIIKHDYGIDGEEFDPNNPNAGKDPSTLPDGSVDKVIAFIQDKFKGDGSTSTGTMGPGAVDGSMFITSEDSDKSGAAADGGEGEDQS